MHRIRDGDESCDSATILESSSRNERDAARDDEWQLAASEECGERYSVCSCVVGVDDICLPRAQDCADPSRGREIPVATHANGGDGDARGAKSSDQGRVGCSDHERLVTLLTLPAREQVDLPLAAAPLSAGVQVEHAKRWGGRHARRMDGVPAGRNAPAAPPWLASQLTAPNVKQL